MFSNFMSNKQLKLITNNGHWQTIFPIYLTNYLININYQRERIYTPDNDFIDLDWINKDKSQPTLVLFHGMEGNSQSHYAKRIMLYLESIGWRGVVAHARGCSGELNKTLSSYHAGFTDDIKLVIDHLKKTNPELPLFAAGVSLGGNALLKFLGENNSNASKLTAAIAISVPFNLETTSATFDSGFNKHVYTPYFLNSLLPKMKRYAEKFPEFKLNPNVKTMEDFNQEYITQMFNFKDSLEYYRETSSIYYLKNIHIPTMIIQAENDPMIPPSAWPAKENLSTNIRFIRLASGGHAGFVGKNRNFKKALLKLPEIMLQYYNKFC